MLSTSVKTRLDNQFCRMNCQMFLLSVQLWWERQQRDAGWHLQKSLAPSHPRAIRPGVSASRISRSTSASTVSARASWHFGRPSALRSATSDVNRIVVFGPE
jgi:hypothetical protein